MLIAIVPRPTRACSRVYSKTPMGPYPILPDDKPFTPGNLSPLYYVLDNPRDPHFELSLSLATDMCICIYIREYPRHAFILFTCGYIYNRTFVFERERDGEKYMSSAVRFTRQLEMELKIYFLFM